MAGGGDLSVLIHKMLLSHCFIFSEVFKQRKKICQTVNRNLLSRFSKGPILYHFKIFNFLPRLQLTCNVSSHVTFTLFACLLANDDKTNFFYLYLIQFV